MPQTSNTTTQGALLKELYTLPPVRVLNDTSYLHDKLTKESATMDFSGKWVRFPVQVARSLGRGSRADGGILPIAIAEVDVEAKALMAFHYHALEWTEVLEEVSKNKEGAFESAVSRKMKNISIDMAKDLNRQWFNGGSIGTIATTPTGVASAAQTFDTVQYVQVGDLLDFYNGASLIGSRTVVSYVKSTRVVTLDSTITTVSTGTIHIAGNKGNEVEGLRNIANKNRTLHAIDGTTYDAWNGNVVNVTGAIAGESTFEQLADRIGERGRGDMDTYLTTRGVRRRLADEFASQRRYLDEKSLDLKTGYRTIQVNGHECVIDDDCPKGYVFALSQDSLKIMQLTKPGFLETEAGDGAVVELKDHTTAGQKVAAWQSWYRYHCSLVCQDPARTGMVPDAEDDAVA